ncbi:MAG TPA: DUF2889 domain-containing protein [Acidimicrobiales bacterium]|jgi:hypothetical protein|nr:DUF2889 domain-containing protein [Acidimicrobiales bacterium]
MTGEPSGGSPVPLHVRTLEYQAFDQGDHLTIIGRLRDTRPWAAEEGFTQFVHDMELRVTVRVEDLTITDSDAVMHRFPHAECPGIVSAFRALAGLQVGRGFTREVQSRFGGPKGCTHLEHLARSLGPVVVQAATSKRARARSRQESDDPIISTPSPWVRNSCHVWAEGGVAEQKVAVGWRPGIGAYPSPPLEEIIEAARSGPAPPDR